MHMWISGKSGIILSAFRIAENYLFYSAQICRFCWHRIRTDENELCPACRKAYSENPAEFKPLSEEQVCNFMSKFVLLLEKNLQFSSVC